MQGVKDVAAMIGAVFGVLSAVVTFYAKYLDLKKKSSPGGEEDEGRAEGKVRRRPSSHRHRSSARVRVMRLPAGADGVSGEAAEVRPPVLLEAAGASPTAADAVRRSVKAPAAALITTGILGIVFNLLVAGYGYVDGFVTPLNAETRARVAAGEQPDQASAALATVATIGFCLASAAAVWAGFNMLRLRSYRLSLAGSVAIMPGACLCFFAGIPIGIWSLTVLLRPEVRETFQ
jgi:hypothetical protein